MKKLAILSLSMMLAAGAQAQNAQFDYFKYAGNDARFNVPIDKSHQYYNPVLAGFRAFRLLLRQVLMAAKAPHPAIQRFG